MTLEEQLLTQRAHAKFLLRERFPRKWSLDLYKVSYPGNPKIPPRISIVGHAIVSYTPEVWREQGATVELIETVTAD